MSSRREAESIIKKIRKSRRANERGGAAADANARSLSRALDMLSTQLYTKTTHFILELVQNADDNTYAPDVDPSLTLVYREDGFLWVGCNEVGFSRANVEAICDINDSTKKVQDATKGYIGEKGIGFKSVFKVADVVWVSSGHYTFKFERDKVLGMIVPVWCDFHATNLLSERTMFCLHIPNIADRNTVKADLLGLQTELLLFLRKLRKIDVRIYDVGMVKPTFWYAHTRRQPLQPQSQTIVTLCRHDLVSGNVDHSEELFISKKIVHTMPFEAKREGVHATEIVLAFPITPSADEIRPRPVFNFLPICSFGFTFILQADFLLTANRENISQDNAWNNALLDGALTLFVAAVQQFNQTGICKYSWPVFTAHSDAAQGTIMQGFMSRLRKSLQDESVLESQAQYLSRPSELMLVPDHFTDGHTPPRPLFDDVLNTFKYASFEYSSSDLASMGLVHQSPQQICAILKWMTPKQLEDKPPSWHSRLAAGIAKSDPAAFESAKLIPLRNGEWISSVEGPFYLPDGDDVVEFPDGIEVKIVERSASSDPARKHLFALLGARPLTGSQVCDLILERHRFLSLSNNNLSADCLISHAWYLFTHGSLGLVYGAVKMANELGQAVSGEELYMQLPDSPFPMKDYLPGSLFSADFVHPSYLVQGDPSQRTRWFRWLTHTLHVSLLPNILSSRKGSITREFQHLIDNHPSRVWMSLVKDNWQHYASDSALLSNRVRAIQVQCTNGRQCQLQDAYLPTAAIAGQPLADRHANLIDLPESTALGWLNLERLGLRTMPDLDFYLAILRGVAQDPAHDADRGIVAQLYEHIQKHCHEDVVHTRAVFTEERLILPQSSTASTWRGLPECRWNSPPCLTSIEPLSAVFPSCKELFATTLEVPDAGPGDVLDDIFNCCTHPQPSRESIKGLLLTLSGYDLTATQLDEPLQRMAQMELVPVRKGGISKFSSFTEVEWFVSDRRRYASRFEGRVWMLEFAKRDAEILRPLLDHLGVTGRELSRHVVEETVTAGATTNLPRITEDLRAKSRYISLWVSSGEFIRRMLSVYRLASALSDQQRIAARMEQIEVCSSADLVLRRSLLINGETIFGDDEKGRAVLQSAGRTSPRLFFSDESVSGSSLPWYLVCDSLLSLLEIPDERHYLLTSILHTQDHALIEDMLERAGILEDA